MTRLSWPPIVERAAEIVDSYSTPVTLRQLHYRLVAAGIIPNTQSAYTTLSSKTAEARREGWFPSLSDTTRQIDRYRSFDGPDDARDYLSRIYRRDRTEGQEVNIYIGVEKRTMLAQLDDWFTDPYGLPTIAVGGYSSQTLADDIREDVLRDGRPSVLLYAGDFDPSGEDILRDVVQRSGCFDAVRRVALTPQQIEDFNLPPRPGKTTDTRARGFVERHGELVQVELEALDQDDLRDLYQRHLDQLLDVSIYNVVLALEREEREELGGAS